MKKYTLLLVISAYACLASAQSIHFSQFNDYKSAFNPAFTGIEPNTDFTLRTIYRNQWASVPVPFTSYGFNADFSLYNDRISENGWFGLGAYVINDKAGDGNLTNTRIQGNIAYHQKLDTRNVLSAGFTFGNDGLNLEPDQLSYAIQWNGSRFNPTLGNGERYNFSNLSYFYINTGVNFTHSTDLLFYRIGYSIMNVNKPVVSFLGNFNQVGIRHFINTEFMIKMGDRFILRPFAMFGLQTQASEFLLGTEIAYDLAPNPKALLDLSLISGLSLRISDAVIPYFGFETSKVRMVLSYDVTVSDLSPYNNGSGAMEIGLSLKGQYPGKNPMTKSLVCPRF